MAGEQGCLRICGWARGVGEAGTGGAWAHRILAGSVAWGCAAGELVIGRRILVGSVARGCATGVVGVGENSAPGLRAERRFYGFPSRELSRDVGCL